MERVQKVSDQARADVEPKKTTGAQLNLDDTEEEKPQKTMKNAVSAIQRIGGGGAAYSNGDPMLREQQRQCTARKRILKTRSAHCMEAGASNARADDADRPAP